MPPTGAGARILVIDDDPQVVEMVTELLTEQGHHVMSALSGPAGVELALQDPPELIVADLFMPGMDGASAVRMLKAAVRTRQIPVIGMTAAAEADVHYLMAAGCVGYVPKPFASQQLLRLVAELLDAAASGR